jgi:glycosyltransferase involved in cell wall biosynthesis
MRICILSDGIPPEGKGGAERVAWNTALWLSERGHAVAVITTTATGEFSRTVEQGITIYRIPSAYHTRWRNWRMLDNSKVVVQVARCLAEIRPDVVHAHNLHQHLSYASLKAARLSGARVYHTFHDMVPVLGTGKIVPKPGRPGSGEVWDYRVSSIEALQRERARHNPWRRRRVQQALADAHGLFAVSQSLATGLQQNGIDGIRVIHNGIDTEHWNPSTEAVEAFRKKHELSAKRIISFGGRLSALKGGDVVLAALPEVVSKVPDAVLLVLGTENAYASEIRARAEVRGLAAHLKFTGWLGADEITAAFGASDLVLVPSLYLDPLPTVALEAMASGKPVVGSTYGGVPEMIVDGVTGTVVDPHDTARFSAAIIDILKDKERALQMGSAGRTRIKQHFSRERYVDELLAAFGA